MPAHAANHPKMRRGRMLTAAILLSSSGCRRLHLWAKHQPLDCYLSLRLLVCRYARSQPVKRARRLIDVSRKPTDA